MVRVIIGRNASDTGRQFSFRYSLVLSSVFVLGERRGGQYIKVDINVVRLHLVATIRAMKRTCAHISSNLHFVLARHMCSKGMAQWHSRFAGVAQKQQSHSTSSCKSYGIVGK